MRIGIDATCLPFIATGASRYIAGLLHGLAKLDSGHEYFIFLKAAHAGTLGALPENMHLVRLPNVARPARMVYQHLLAGLHAQRLRLEVWHGTHYSLPRFAHEVALIATFHDLSFWEYPGFFSESRLRYFQYVMADAARRASTIVCVSNATREALARRFPVNGRAVTVHSGVDQIFFKRLSDREIHDAQRALKIPEAYVLFLSTIERHKNLPLALQAMSLLRRHDLHLVIAGQAGSGWREASNVIRKLGLIGAVHYVGYVAEEQLPALYQGARLLVLPSIIEGFGFPLLEAMAGGVPVLAAQSTNASATSEVVSHPDMLCEHDAAAWAAKMENLIYDAPRRRELSAYAVARAAQFSWQTTAERMVEVYETAAASKRPRLHVRVNGTSGTPTPAEKKNGAALHHPDAKSEQSALEQAVLRTIVYADMFDYPLRPQEIHHGLLEYAASENDVIAALGKLQRLKCIARTGEWWHLTGRAEIISERLRRAAYTRKLWHKNAWVLKFVCGFPFVRSVALSGAGAFENCRPAAPRAQGEPKEQNGANDIDLFIIAEAGRLWLTYAALVLVLKVLGKRKLVCLNYLISNLDLEIPGGKDRDFFVAHQIAFLKPLRGNRIFEEFFNANAWIHRHLPQTSAGRQITPPALPIAPEGLSPLQRLLEGILRQPVFNRLEQIIYFFYSRRILRLAGHLGNDAIEVAPGRIKLFTNNHRFHLRERLETRFEKIWHGSHTNFDNHPIPQHHSEMIINQTQEG